MAELTLEESVQQVLPTLPLPIQKFFEQRKLGEVARLIMERYALHVDQGAILERELMLLLLGLKNPDEFAEELYAQLPTSKQTVRDIIADVNQEIFVPLREEMRKGGGSQQVAPASPKATEETAQEGILQPRTTIIPANPTLPPKAPQTLTPTSNYAPKPPPPRSVNLITGTEEQRSALRDALNAVTIGPKPVATNRMLEDHEEPRIEFKKTSPPSRPLPPNPFGVFSASKPPTNLPGAMPPRPVVSDKVQAISPSPISAPLKPSNLPPTPSAKPYSSDPYREPIV